ncbi:MAG: hypothetical protein PHQ75_06275, partial [Thermoguttaceae bacterium]|nr:hypothetical protein [Thermoguttaceae bacterium]
MKRGDEFPPVVVFWDGAHEEYVLADGFHRMEALKRINSTAFVPAQVKLGTEMDARWYAICANKDNGLRRSNADKRRAVELALLHPRGAKMSNRLIARFLGVSEFLIRDIRKQLESTAILSQSTLRIGADGREIDTSNIGESQVNFEDKTCLECKWYRNGRCMYSADYKEPEEPACEEFCQLVITEPEPVPDRSNVKILENWGDKTPKRKNLHAYQSRDSITIKVPKKVMLAAVELRHVYGQEWLDDLGIYIINMKQQMD